MKNLISTLFAFGLLLSTFSLQAQQFQDDFTDGDFTNNPVWLGSTADFIVNGSNELQLNNLGFTAESTLYSAAAIADSTTWEFYVRLNLDPSGSNRTRVYLQSDNSNLTDNLNGYYIQIGESGANDAVELFRQTGATSTSVLRGTDGQCASNPNVRLRITRDNAGNWTLEADYTGGTTFVVDGTGTDATHNSGSYIGLWCDYTSTKGDLFFFDDFNIGPLYVDTDPPSLVSASAPSSTQIDAQFDEPLDQATAENIANYAVDLGISVSNATLNADPTIVNLTVSPMTSQTVYQLTATGIEDVANNAMAAEQVNFTYVDIQIAVAKDIVISEIFADPTPQVGLPDAEYLELYNRSNKAIDLTGFDLNDNTPHFLPAHLLLPDSFVILCSSANVALLQPYGTVLDIGSLTLTNGGEMLRLLNSGGLTLDSLVYTDDWYQDPAKDGGGWSLELINPDQTCIGAANWIVSSDPSGGTPGRQNSVYDPTPDTQAPSVTDVQQNTATTIHVIFDEVLDAASANNSVNYTLDNGLTVSNANKIDDYTVELTVSPDMTHGITYQVTVNGVSDCIGNPNISTNSFIYYDFDIAEHYDIIINEIFADYNPQIGLPEKDFIELYNRSNRIINLENFTITDASSITGVMPFYILQPGDYVILYDGSDSVGYSQFGPVLPLADFPAFDVGGDDVLLYDNLGNVIDAVSYDQSWYGNGDKADGGWSLERINPNHPCAGSENWIASENLIGGTPGQANSVLQTEADLTLPDALRAYPFSADSIRIFFTEALGDTSAINAANYSIDGGLTVLDAYLETPFYNTVVVALDAPLAMGTTYTITMGSGLTDCVGNSIAILNNSVLVALPDTIEVGDIILNELLHNPVSGGKDFIELYNKSAKVLNIADLILANTDDFGQINQTENVLTDWLLFPQNYVVLTEEPSQVKEQYTTENPNNFVENGMPSYADDEGTVIIFATLDTAAYIIDQFDYTDEYHSPLIDDLNGVSLERIDFDAPTQDRNNWHSAATDVGSATPAYLNSSFVDNTIDEDLISLPDNTFSPDGDGFEDFLLINYNLGALGYVANINIYDSRGILIRQLVNGELFSDRGSLQWDGTDDAGQKALIGIYIIGIELFNPNGDVQRFKKTCVVAGQL